MIAINPVPFCIRQQTRINQAAVEWHLCQRLEGQHVAPVGTLLGRSLDRDDQVLDPDAKGPKTKFKLMAFPEAPGKMQDQKFIHSSIGVSYLTLYVTDMNKSVARLKEAKVQLLGKTPTDLGGGNFITVFRDPDGNFIELIGPKK